MGDCEICGLPSFGELVTLTLEGTASIGNLAESPYYLRWLVCGDCLNSLLSLDGATSPKPNFIV